MAGVFGLGAQHGNVSRHSFHTGDRLQRGLPGQQFGGGLLRLAAQTRLGHRHRVDYFRMLNWTRR